MASKYTVINRGFDPEAKRRAWRVFYGWLVAINVSVLGLLVYLSPSIVLTATQTTGSGIFSGQNVTLGQYINNVYGFAIGAAAIAAVLMIIVGGFMYTTSGGNTSRASIGKDMIISALIGLLLVLTAFIFLGTINKGLVDYPNKLGDKEDLAPSGSNPVK